MKISKNLFVKLVKESKKIISKPLLKEMLDSKSLFIQDMLKPLTPEERDMVIRITRDGYKGHVDPEALEYLNNLRNTYRYQSYENYPDVYKAIIEIQEINKEDYKDSLAGHDNDYYPELEPQISPEEQMAKTEEEELDKKLDDLYHTQDELSNIRVRESKEAKEPLTDEEKIEIMKQDPEFDEFHKKQDEKEKLAAEDEYYKDLIDSLQDAESEHQYHLDREYDRMIGRK